MNFFEFDIYKLIEDNVILLLTLLAIVAAFHLLISPINLRLKYRLKYNKLGKFVAGSTVIKLIKKALLVVVIAILVGFQQKYEVVQLGKEENFNALVISILALYGILYTFLQFTIGYAVQNKEDKYWGRSITRRLFIERLGFDIFRSSLFKLLLLYVVVYPLASKGILEITNRIRITPDFAPALWETSVVMIYILYAHLFIQSLNGMRVLYAIQERGVTTLHLDIEEEVAEKYNHAFEYSYDKKRDYFINELFDDLKSLPEKEQPEFLMHVLMNVFPSVRFTLGYRWKFVNKISGMDGRRFNYIPYHLNHLFNRLYDQVETNNIALNMSDRLLIHKWHDDVLIKSIVSMGSEDRDFIIQKLVKIYSDRNAWGGSCSYFKIPSMIKQRISSFEDIEDIHRHMTQREGFAVIEKDMRSPKSERSASERMLLKSYDRYLEELLDCYKDYTEELKRKSYSVFWGSIRSFNKTDPIDAKTSNEIYDYIIGLEYTVQNKNYALFMANQLEYKYRVAIVFYHLLYTGNSWKWQDDVIFLRDLASSSRTYGEGIDSQIIEFVCHIIKKRGNIGHRIGRDLIRSIFQHIHLRQLNEEIVNWCLSEDYISYAKLLKFIYIFSDHRYYPMNFYDFDFNEVQSSGYPGWEIEFLHEMLQTPDLLKEKLIAEHLMVFCQKISYPTHHFVLENDFRGFFINRFFKFSESQFLNLIDNDHYLGKGLIEFLILRLADSGYEYLSTGDSLKTFASRAREIIDDNNMSTDSYVMHLVERANECRENAISIAKMEDILKELKRCTNRSLVFN